MLGALQCYERALREARADIISRDKAIKQIDVYGSPWSFDNGTDLYNRLSMFSAIKRLVEEECDANGGCGPQSSQIKKAIAYLDRTPEFHLEAVEAKNFHQRGSSSNDSISANFWPSLQDHLLFRWLPGGGAAVWNVSGLQCGVCIENMVFEGTMGPDGRPRPHVTQAPGMGDRLAVVLPCGHILCKPCLDTIREGCDDATCPFCKARLKYECGHYFEDLPAPETPQDYQAFPCTVPEGATLPLNCDPCVWQAVQRIWDEDCNALLRKTDADILFLEYARGAGQLVTARAPSKDQLERVGQLKQLAKFADELIRCGEESEDTHPSWCKESSLSRYVAKSNLLDHLNIYEQGHKERGSEED